MFRAGTEKRVKSGVLKPGGTATMHWIDSVNAPYGHQLYFALGGFTVRSDVVVKSTVLDGAAGQVFRFTTWTCEVHDAYNWDKFKSTAIPMLGEIDDEDLALLEKHGYGRSFDLRSHKWTVQDKECLQEFSVSGT